MVLCVDLLKGVICPCCFSDSPRFQHSRGAVPRTGHHYWGDFGRLSLFTRGAAPHQDQRMYHGPSCPSEPHRDIWIWVRNLRYTDTVSSIQLSLELSMVLVYVILRRAIRDNSLLHGMKVPPTSWIISHTVLNGLQYPYYIIKFIKTRHL